MGDSAKRDLKKGIAVNEIPDGGMIQGQADGEDVVLARRGDEFFAVGAACTHYQGPLAEGLMVGDTVRCPWHHACFSLGTGEALRAPAFDPIACWNVETVDGKVFVREKMAVAPKSLSGSSGKLPESVVIIGGGAAGLAAADMLRREGYGGSLTMISADESAPYDRPNLSKEYLAGKASDDWIPLRSPEYYKEHNIELVLGSRVSKINVQQKSVALENAKTYPFEALLLATGASPVELKIEGEPAKQVQYLRTYADSQAIIAKAASAKRVAIVGASFIGLEVAWSLRERDIAVDVVAPESQPLERVLGPEVGKHVRKVHEAHGVVFHLGENVKRIDGATLTLSGGSRIEADFVVVGVGVQPALSLAQEAGLRIDRGIVVDEYLETSVPGIFAAGDIARWPDPHSGERIRVEHWVVAERQGQTAAKNILGYRQPFDAVPFFWSQQHDLVIHYSGHAEKWDAIEIDGKLEESNCTVRYKKDGRTLAVVTMARDLESLQIEAAMETEPPAVK